MSTDKKNFVSQLIDKMTLEQKVGQCFVIGFCGTVVTPAILKRIRKIKPAGIRAGLTFRAKTALHDPYATSEVFAHRVLREPKGSVKDIIPGLLPPHCTNEEYCTFLNTMKEEALKDGMGIPLHVTMDMEGDVSCDYTRGGIFNFPFPLGAAATGNPQMAYDMAWATGRQLHALGVNWLHSPVLDTNTEPNNPEIGARSYGENSETVIKYGTEGFKGFKAAGIITTGKHFPGRGESVTDAHRGLPVIDIPRAQMEEHLKPFKAMVDAGIPCIMTAHTVYPCLDPDNAATLSKKILTDLLKNEWGFKGCVTTDDITMGGIVEKYEVADACVVALNAGCDLILLRDEAPLIDEVYEKVVQAVRDGKLSEERINDAVRRSLTVKYEYGLFENGNVRDVAKAGDGIKDPKVAKIAKASADAAVKVIRDEQKVLPLKKGKSVLVIEQRCPLHYRTDTQKCHPGIFWENFFKYTEDAGQIEVEMSPTEYDMKRIMKRVNEADVIVTTNYFDRRAHAKGNFIDQILAATSKPVVVVTNSPYPFTVSPEYKTVVCTYGVAPESLEAAVRTLYDAKQ
jgi:beta-N-acetylhexosaminidase